MKKSKIQPQERSKRGSTKPHLSQEQISEFQKLHQDVDPPLQSILISANRVKAEKPKPRFDGLGTQIEKGKKRHRIVFKQDIEQIIPVENWKQYNLDSEQDQEKCCLLI